MFLKKNEVYLACSGDSLLEIGGIYAYASIRNFHRRKYEKPQLPEKCFIIYSDHAQNTADHELVLKYFRICSRPNFVTFLSNFSIRNFFSMLESENCFYLKLTKYFYWLKLENLKNRRQSLLLWLMSVIDQFWDLRYPFLNDIEDFIRINALKCVLFTFKTSAKFTIYL